jgi:hypothetical protein
MINKGKARKDEVSFAFRLSSDPHLPLSISISISGLTNRTTIQAWCSTREETAQINAKTIQSALLPAFVRGR